MFNNLKKYIKFKYVITYFPYTLLSIQLTFLDLGQHMPKCIIAPILNR